MPKECHVAVSILRVHTPIAILYSIIEQPIAGWWFSNVNDIQPISTEKEYEVSYQHKGLIIDPSAGPKGPQEGQISGPT